MWLTRLVLRIRSIKMIGRHGHTSPANTSIKSSVTISPSQTPSVSKRPSRRKLATHCSSKSIRSDQSLNLSRLPPTHTPRDGALWSLIVPVRRRIRSSQISSLVSVLDKSRPEHRVAGLSPATREMGANLK